MPAPAAPPAPAPAADVTGFEIERHSSPLAPVVRTSAWAVAALAMLVAVGGFFWRLRGDRGAAELPA
jgi:hypothetical protein